MLHNSLGGAAEEDMLETGSTVRWHDNQIGGKFLSEPADFFERRMRLPSTVLSSFAKSRAFLVRGICAEEMADLAENCAVLVLKNLPTCRKNA